MKMFPISTFNHSIWHLPLKCRNSEERGLVHFWNIFLKHTFELKKKIYPLVQTFRSYNWFVNSTAVTPMSFATVGMSKIYCPCLFSDLKNHKTKIQLNRSMSVSRIKRLLYITSLYRNWKFGARLHVEVYNINITQLENSTIQWKQGKRWKAKKCNMLTIITFLELQL